MVDTKISAMTAATDLVSATVPIVQGAANKSAAIGLFAAAQAAQEAGSSSTVFTTPAVQHFHPSAAKCMARVTVSVGVPTLAQSYNVTSITDTALGQLTVTIATDFSSADWFAFATGQSAGGAGRWISVDNTTAPTAGAILLNGHTATATLADPSVWFFVGFGDQ